MSDEFLETSDGDLRTFLSAFGLISDMLRSIDASFYLQINGLI